MDDITTRNAISIAKAYLNASDNPVTILDQEGLWMVAFDNKGGSLISVDINPKTMEIFGYDNKNLRGDGIDRYSESDIFEIANLSFKSLVSEKYRNEYKFLSAQKIVDVGYYRIWWNRFVNNIPIIEDRFYINIDYSNGNIIKWRLTYNNLEDEIDTSNIITKETASQLSVDAYGGKIIKEPELYIKNGELLWLLTLEISSGKGRIENKQLVLGLDAKTGETKFFDPSQGTDLKQEFTYSGYLPFYYKEYGGGSYREEPNFICNNITSTGIFALQENHILIKTCYGASTCDIRTKIAGVKIYNSNITIEETQEGSNDVQCLGGEKTILIVIEKVPNGTYNFNGHNTTVPGNLSLDDILHGAEFYPICGKICWIEGQNRSVDINEFISSANKGGNFLNMDWISIAMIGTIAIVGVAAYFGRDRIYKMMSKAPRKR